MKPSLFCVAKISTISLCVALTACSNVQGPTQYQQPQQMASYNPSNYENRLPQHYDTKGKKTVLVDPNVHAWGAYSANGELVRGGIATAGAAQCPEDAADESDCRTGSGTFHITSMRGEECFSKKYPRPDGGGLMPYCMYFNNGQALHGSPDSIVREANLSHGCVRMRIPDAEWMQHNFASVGTKVVVVPYVR